MKSCNKALQGMTVLDLTRVLAGPYCSMLLADMGANVIKIETPGKGDDSRDFAPMVNGESIYYANLNRNKKGITLNLKTDKGKDIFKSLVATADVVLENYRPGTMERLGLGYDTLKQINPSIIYGCVSGFGHYGPYSKRGGYDIIGQAMGGLMSTTGWPDGEPTRTGTAIGDVLAGLSICIGVLAAYNYKQLTGKGQKVDVALVDSVVSSLEIINQIYIVTGRIPQRIGNRYESCYPYDSFKAKDGSMIIACGNDKLWALLCELMEMPQLIKDERFYENQLRVQNHVLLKQIIEDWLKDYTVNEAVSMMLDSEIPAAPIFNVAQVVNDEHIAKAREMFVGIEHPVAGKIKITGNHIKMSGTPITSFKHSPLLGQHNEEIYKEYLGLTGQEYKNLIDNNVI